MFQRYKDRAEFFLVYIREAHPSDGWQVPRNERDGVVHKEPTTADERALLASQCLKDMHLSLPCLIDDMRGTVNDAYAAWPARYAIVDVDGKLAYYGEPGPRGFRPADAEAALKRVLDNEGKMPQP